jgi:hypothetical protein
MRITLFSLEGLDAVLAAGLVGLVTTPLVQEVIRLKEKSEIDNKNLLREGSFPFITNALVFLSSLLIQYRNRIFVNVDTNPTTQGF